MNNELILAGVPLAVIVTIIIALHQITSKEIGHLKESLTGEAQRLKESNDDAKKLLSDQTKQTEQRLRDEIILRFEFMNEKIQMKKEKP